MIRTVLLRPRGALAVLAFVSLGLPDPAAGDVQSHEFKLLLDPALFKDASHDEADQVWRDELRPKIDTLKESGVKITKAKFKKKKTKHRVVRYLDLAKNQACLFRPQRITLRQRDTLEDGQAKESKLTLKFRRDDATDLASLGITGDSLDPKAELDLVWKPKRATDGEPGVDPIYSYSFSIESEGAGPALPILADPIERFEGLDDHLPTTPVAWTAEDSLKVVSGLQVSETVFKGVKLTLDKAEAKGALTLWHLDGASRGQPDVAEFSFSVDPEDRNGTKSDALRALGEVTLTVLSDLADTNAETKTSRVYGHGAFCESSE